MFNRSGGAICRECGKPPKKCVLKRALLVGLAAIAAVALASCAKPEPEIDYETMTTEEIVALATGCDEDTASTIAGVFEKCGVEKIENIELSTYSKNHWHVYIPNYVLRLSMDKKKNLKRIDIPEWSQFNLYGAEESNLVFINGEERDYYIERTREYMDQTKGRLVVDTNIGQMPAGSYEYAYDWLVVRQGDEVLVESRMNAEYPGTAGNGLQPAYGCFSAVYNKKDELSSFDLNGQELVAK